RAARILPATRRRRIFPSPKKPRRATKKAHLRTSFVNRSKQGIAMPDNLLWIILGMSLITGMFRVLPPILVRYAEPPAVLLDVLSSMPYAVLGAFLFPSVFSVGAEPWMGAVTVALVVVMALY